MWIDSNWWVLSPHLTPNSLEMFVFLRACVSLKEIIEEVRKELHQVKEEIINGEFGVKAFLVLLTILIP